MGRNIVVGCVSCFFLFSMQNQVPQIVIGMNRVIYNFEALSVVNRNS